MKEPANGYGELNWEGDEQEKRNSPPAPQEDPSRTGTPRKHEEAPGRNPAPTRPEGDDAPSDLERDRGIENPDEDREGG